MEKTKIKEWLKKEKWYPFINPTKEELEVSKLLNKILDDIISRIDKEL